MEFSPNERRRILLVNDDGIDAPGLVELLKLLVNHYDVRVVAPAVEKSAQSHSITIHNLLIAEKLADRCLFGGTGVRSQKDSGTNKNKRHEANPTTIATIQKTHRHPRLSMIAAHSNASGACPSATT